MKKEETARRIDREKEEEAAARAIAAMIRQSSEAGQLISHSEILGRLAGEDLPPPVPAGPPEGAGGMIRKAVEESGDLHAFAAEDGSRHYYSSTFMTEAYARILLQKQGNPLRLIAEVVRENSALYPRPVPLDLFTRPPFGLDQQEILDDLKRMEGEEAYRDIVPTTTSTSRVFLYSTLHLEPDHASMLAEWLDVGQSNNP
jgi:hypothetical protein